MWKANSSVVCIRWMGKVDRGWERRNSFFRRERCGREWFDYMCVLWNGWVERKGDEGEWNNVTSCGKGLVEEN